MSTDVHRFSRWAAADTPMVLTAGAGALALTFSLDQVASSAEFTTLFDQYRLDRVVVHVSWSNTALGSGTVNPDSITAPVLRYLRDYDDNTTPTDTAMRQHSQTKQFSVARDQTYTISLKPAMLTPVYRGAASADGYLPSWNKFIDCGRADVPHFGLKLYANVNNADAGSILLRTKYYFTCKAVR